MIVLDTYLQSESVAYVVKVCFLLFHTFFKLLQLLSICQNWIILVRLERFQEAEQFFKIQIWKKKI